MASDYGCSNCGNTTDGLVSGLCSTCYLKYYGDLNILKNDLRYKKEQDDLQQKLAMNFRMVINSDKEEIK